MLTSVYTSTLADTLGHRETPRNRARREPPMTGSIALTEGIHSTLQARQGLSVAQGTATRRLATGLKIGAVTDDAKNYLRAQALTDRVGALRGVKDDIGQAISSLKATQAGTSAIEDLTRQLKGIVNAAKSASASEKSELAAQFDVIRDQITAVANDTSYQGRALIADTPDTADVVVSDDGDTTLTVTGRASDSASLGIGDGASYNDFATSADIDAALSAIETATNTVRSNESSIASSASALQTRESFSENLANTLQAGADKLTLADTTEEAARLLAVKARDGLAVQAQRIAGQSDRFIADLIQRTG